MAFRVGDRLGRFEILGALGAGGMGEVYRARDPHLQREVAVKVLPVAFWNDPDRRRRFEQEARTAGGLNHPNILAVFEVGVQGASSYIVTELLAGETLRERMGERPLPARRAAEYALQIANGLAAAHDRGVVHRDIKPDNLFVTTDGRIKILDFGLAKFVGPDSSGDTETISVDGTQQAQVVGTVAYMSPEQTRGLRIDHRTDIFSFGAVLYEMLAGFPPFKRDNTADTLNAILHDEPTALPARDPLTPVLEHVVRHCLEKKPEERYQHCRDLAFQLRPEELDSARVRRRQTGRRRDLAVAGAIIAATLAAALLGGLAASQWILGQPLEGTHRILQMTNVVGLEEFPAIAPDGRMVAFTAAQQGRRQIFVRFITGGSGAPLPVTHDDADHQLPRWSQDGSSLLYFSPAAPGEVQGTIHRIPALGGPAQRVIASIGGGDVSSDGRLACFRLEKDRIQLITASLEGSDVRIVSELETKHYAYPRWSPDRKWLAFQAGDGFRWDVFVVAASGGERPAPLTNESRIIRGLTWLPDSSGIIYSSARGSTLPYLPPLSLWEVRLKGRQPPVQRTPPEASYEQPDLHASGLMAATRMQMRFSIWKHPFSEIARKGGGRGELLVQETGHLSTPTAAPSGDEIAYLSDNGGHANLWVAPASGAPRRITAEDDPQVSVGASVWSPDGKWIAFVSSKGNVGFVFGLWLVKPDGSELHQIVPKGLSPAWSEDGRWLYYVESSSTPIKRIATAGGASETVRSQAARSVIGTYGSTVYFVVERALVDGRPQFELHAAPVGEGPSRRIKIIPAAQVPTSWQVVNPSLSPDGKWMAVPLTDGFTTNVWAISTEDGRSVQVTDFVDRAVFIARRVSWSADGRSIISAVAEGDADIVVLDGLFKRTGR